jgi:hypothetical protein
MSDWIKQAEEMFKAWGESQQKIMESWAESMKGMAAPQGADMWEKAISTWEETLDKSAQAQAEWTEKWVENLKSTEGIPEPAVESIDRFVEITERWTATQADMSAKWFEMLRSLDPGSFTGKLSEAFQNPFQIWQDATKQILDAQSEWMRTWTGSTGDASEGSDQK